MQSTTPLTRTVFCKTRAGYEEVFRGELPPVNFSQRMLLRVNGYTELDHMLSHDRNRRAGLRSSSRGCSGGV